MATAEQKKFVSQIDANKAALIDRLAKAVSIPSVSGDAAYRKHCFEMADWLLAELKQLGATAELKPLGKQVLDGQEIELPPVILGDLGKDPKKKTILVYGHFDVQPALKSDGWDTEPFELITDEKTGRMYGRGSTDDKGPILGWLNAIEAHQQAGIEMPVNLKFCFEGMEESGSVGLDELIAAEKDSFFQGVDAVCISDNYWLGTQKPCLTHGLRGIAYFKLAISGPARDLHSGVFGGVVHEPMTDLFTIMSKLVTAKGEILIPGIKELVAPLTDEERKRYDVMDFQLSDIEGATGSKTTVSDDKAAVLMGRMRYPCLSLHGIEGAFSEPGTKTVIPAKVVGKFSLRLVPDMTPEKVNELVTKYVNDEFAKIGSKKHDEPHERARWQAVAGRPQPLELRGGDQGDRDDLRREAGSDARGAARFPSRSRLPTRCRRTCCCCRWAAATTARTRSTRSSTSPTTLRAPSSSASTCTRWPPSTERR
ncbi:hypothetical protein L1887_60525 [Cichorium endivia]|nr:hypothetical protein L1887_60525 [Cichorium endivia]